MEELNCDRCGSLITNTYTFNGKTYGSTCIKKVLRKSGRTASRKYGYLYNDASAIIQMLEAEKNYAHGPRESGAKKELYKKMKTARDLVGSEARKAIGMANSKRGVTYSPPSNEPRFWETYYLAKKIVAASQTRGERCCGKKNMAEQRDIAGSV